MQAIRQCYCLAATARGEEACRQVRRGGHGAEASGCGAPVGESRGAAGARGRGEEPAGTDGISGDVDGQHQSIHKFHQ